MENKLYRVYCGGAGGSGHSIYLVLAKDEVEAVEIIKNNTFYHLGLSPELVEISEAKPFALIEQYDNPDYEG